MKRRLSLLAFLALCYGCNGDDSPSNPQSHDPVPTAPGVPDGAPTATTIGPGGGSLASSDGLFTVEIPAGALTVDAEIGIQPITNTAWGGLGRGYRLTPDGLTFATPVDLAFTIPDSMVASTAPEFLDVAVQDDAGLWYVLKNRAFDAGTLTATTTHFSDYSAISGVQIEPVQATVQTGKTVALSVRYCSFEPITGDQELVALAASCDNEVVPLGTFTNWSVNGIKGGGADAGIVAENGSPIHAIYTAPNTVPSANPVAVSVMTNFEGHQALLVSNITVTDAGSWAGTSVMNLADGTTITSNITWTYSNTNGTLVNYVPSGLITYNKPAEGDCPITSITPNQHPIASEDGFLSIDGPSGYYNSAGATIWTTTICHQCAYDEVPVCGDTYIGGQWMVTDFGVKVSEDGRTISDTVDLGGGSTFTYTFTKQP
jgi:hypothetical protein